jgi:hypothetical protein
MEHLSGSLAAALFLAGAYLFSGWFSPRGRSKEFWERRRWISAAAGVSVAYVFVDLLPELGAQQRVFAEAAENAGLLFVQERMYTLALASFVVFYGLDHMVLSKREERRTAVNTGDRDTIYWLHLVGFAVYSGLIGYLLVERAERGWLSLAAYAIAMAVHFLIVGHSLAEEHGLQHRSSGVWLLALSVLAGCLLGSTIRLSETMFARLLAVIAGGVVITSVGHELPGERQGRFWPFCLGAVLFALMLLGSEEAAERSAFRIEEGSFRSLADRYTIDNPNEFGY